MNEEMDRFLTEAMGECWHEYEMDKPVLTCKGGGFVCRKCGELIVGNSDFSSREDFSRLWSWVVSHENSAALRASLRVETTDGPPDDRESRTALAEALYRVLQSPRD